MNSASNSKEEMDFLSFIIILNWTIDFMNC